jgi:hypothetical protein
MINKIKLILLSLVGVFGFAAPLAFTATASAVITQPQVNNGLCHGANGDFNQTDETGCDDQAASTVIMIIYAGFRYVTSGGRDESVKGAKNTILYAIIGLVIVALAQIIVHFVLAKTTQATQP